uniref:Microfibril associated protein 5 n=1 Tax=Maylandia zebra TaxID=106582 RepID=A0A3P9CIT4_9CICH
MQCHTTNKQLEFLSCVYSQACFALTIAGPSCSAPDPFNPLFCLHFKCREETYPCTRMYSVHKPIKRCIGSLCLYSLPRVYVINKEICVRTVCREDEYLKAELCRELSGWPRRIQRSSNSKRCRNRRGNPQTWANKA